MLSPGAVDFRRARYVLGFDTEGYRFPTAPNPTDPKKTFTRNPVTRLVCSTWAGRVTDPLPEPIAQGGDGVLLQRGPKGWRALLDREASRAMFKWTFGRTDVLLVVHNAPYDLMMVLHTCRRHAPTCAGVFRALADGRVADTANRERLLAIAEGWTSYDPVLNQKPPKYDLASCVKRHFGQEVAGKEGEDVWRVRYHELDGVPLAQWPAAAVDYALMDAEWALLLAISQAPLGSPRVHDYDFGPFTTPEGGVVDETRQLRGALPLMLQSAWSVPTDPITVAEWGDEIEAALVDANRGLVRLGVTRVAGSKHRTGKRAGKTVAPGEVGSKDTRYLGELVAADLTAQGLQVPRTPTGLVQTGAEVLALCTTPELKLWASEAHYEKWRSTYLAPARIGTQGVLPYNYNPLINTGRTSSFNANAQNPPKKGRFRECVRARPGKVLASIDFDAAELKGLGCIHYWLFGQSVYRDMAAAGIDLHAPLAAMIWGKTLDEYLEIYNDKAHPLYQTAKTIYRQLAKAGNFGGWGGLGPVKFSGVAEDQYDVDLAAIAKVTGDDVQYRERFQALCDAVARGEVPRDVRGLLPEAKGTWNLAYRDEDGNVCLPRTATVEDLYVRYSFARKLLDILRKQAVPEGGQYLDLIAQAVKGAGGEATDDEPEGGPKSKGFTYVQWVSQRQRAGCDYTNGANTGFQGIVADGAKEALWRVCVMAYLPPEDAVGILWRPDDPDVYWGAGVDRATVLEWATALYGTRPVLFIHDEIIAEGDEATAHLWAPAMARVMCEAMATFIRDVHVTASPALMYTWDKRAEPAYDTPEGTPGRKLIVWKPPA